VTDVGGFSGNVTLAVSGLPTGVTAAFATNPTTAASILTLMASGTAAAGNFTITVTGTSGAVTSTTHFALNTSSTKGNGFACHIGYTLSSEWGGGFGAAITINNTGTTAISSWTLTWTFANGQTVTQLWNGNVTQSGANVSVTNESYNGSIASGGSYSAMGFNGTWNNTTNASPTSFAVNGVPCQ
jgi:xyloglucan-specific exo-beta-1,4-glucanase